MILETIHGNTGPSNSTAISTVVGNLEIPNINSIVDEYAVMQLPAFWRAVRFIAGTLASVPKYVVKDGARIEHRLNFILGRRINSYARPMQVWETYFHHAVIWGNGYTKITRDAGGNVSGLCNVNPEIVTPFIYYPDDGTEPLRYFAVPKKTSDGSTEYIAIADADMTHLAGVGFDGIRGYPMVQLMRQALEVGKQAESHSLKYFKKNSFVRGAIEFPGVLTAEQLAALQDSLQKFRGGDSQSAFDLMVLQANGKLNNSTVPNETSQLIETRKFSIGDIARMTDVPPHILYDMGDAKWANIEYMAIEVVRYGLGNWAAKAEDELTAKLLTDAEQEQGLSIEFDFDELLRGDSNAETDKVIKVVNNGLATPNWGAKELGLPDLGEQGNKLRIPVAVSQPLPVGSGATATPKAAAEPTPAPAAPAETPAAPDYNRVAEPLLIDVCGRVESKTAKAFERRDGKPDAELLPWAQTFADEQARTVAKEFAPLASALAPLGFSIDPEAIGAAYRNEILSFAGTKQKRSLIEIAKESIHGQR